jgi:predicted extracellular nuclease
LCQYLLIPMKLIFTILTLAICFLCNSQTLITKWTFDNSTNTPDSGSGSFAPEGGTAFTSYVAGNPSTGKAYGTNTYPTQSTNNEKAGVKIKVSTTGYKDLSFKFEQYNSNTASKKTIIMVSGDGVNFTKVDSIVASSGTVWTSKNIDLSGYSFLNNKTEIQILLVSGFVGSSYAASGSTSSYGTTGTWRFDNVAVYGKVATQATKNYLDITSSKTNVGESSKDTVALYFKLRDTLTFNLNSKLSLSGTAITTGDYRFLGRDSIRILKGKKNDTLKLVIIDDANIESSETASVVFTKLDTNVLVGQNISLSITDNDVAVTRIASIQGSGSASQMQNALVVVEGIVTADLQGTNEQGGFYLQDVINDTLKNTSEGIFVKESSTFAVNEGDRVKISGKVLEEFGQTILSNITSLQIVSSGNTVAATDLKLPVDSISHLERFEGMKMRVTQKLTVTENYQLGRYGEIQVSVNGRLINPSNYIDPNDADKNQNSTNGNSNASSVLAQQSLNNRSKLLVCDKLSIQNPNPIPFLDPIEKTLRIGSTIDTMTGVLGYGFSAYRVYPSGGTLKIKYATRPTVPVFTGANLKVSSLNVLNFFNGDGLGGGYPTARGAKTANELVRQKAKIVAAIKAMDPDVLGLMEIENDGDSALSAIRELVTAINAEYGSTVFDLVKDPIGVDGTTGTDAIKVAMIYKKAVVTPFGKSKGYNDSAFTLLGRPPLAQTFTLMSNSEKFTVIVNHFKSKSCAASPSDSKDLDQNDGQGCFNATRKKQSTALLTFISSIISNTKDSDVLVIGDLNAYGQEDPIDVLRAGGLNDLLGETYSYMFDGQAGSLDHAMATASMLRAKVGADKWHINCDEPMVIDYTTSFKTQDLYQPNYFRSSDHDPVIAVFNILKKNNAIAEYNKEVVFDILPNPNSGLFSLRLKTDEPCYIKIVDLTGKVVIEYNDIVDDLNVNLTSLKGVYFIELKTTTQTQVKKLFINN